MKRYEFDSSAYLEYAFNQHYRSGFYEVINGKIILKKMSNGLHREVQSKTKKTFNNRTLKKTLEKVQNDLLYHFGVLPQTFKFNEERYHNIRFNMDSKNYVDVAFDKLKWSYEVKSASFNSVALLHAVTDAFEKHTKHLRAHRKKTLHEDNTEQ
jgi:hypothetical protein